MAEQIIVMMGIWDDETQKVLSGWYDELSKAGFKGKQTPNLLYHISLSTYTTDKEEEASGLIRSVAGSFAPVQVCISHIGMFAGGQILFAAPDINPGLMELHDACDLGVAQEFEWTPHTTLMIDDPVVIQSALPMVINSFRPLTGTIKSLQLCAFWPTREIVHLDLNE